MTVTGIHGPKSSVLPSKNRRHGTCDICGGPLIAVYIWQARKWQWHHAPHVRDYPVPLVVQRAAAGALPVKDLTASEVL